MQHAGSFWPLQMQRGVQVVIGRSCNNMGWIVVEFKLSPPFGIPQICRSLRYHSVVWNRYLNKAEIIVNKVVDCKIYKQVTPAAARSRRLIAAGSNGKKKRPIRSWLVDMLKQNGARVEREKWAAWTNRLVTATVGPVKRVTCESSRRHAAV